MRKKWREKDKMCRLLQLSYNCSVGEVVGKKSFKKSQQYAYFWGQKVANKCEFVKFGGSALQQVFQLKTLNFNKKKGKKRQKNSLLLS